MKYQFNKTELQRLNKDLKIRVQALPTLKNKESALRAEVIKHKERLKKLVEQLKVESEKIAKEVILFSEYPQIADIIKIASVSTSKRKIAGIATPELEKIDFVNSNFSLFTAPGWVLDGLEMIKKISTLKISCRIEKQKIAILELARKKTTQKVNLYEKVQIPEFQGAIINIKRFLEDMDNLDRASQKIVKKRRVFQ